MNNYNNPVAENIAKVAVSIKPLSEYDHKFSTNPHFYGKIVNVLQNIAKEQGLPENFINEAQNNGHTPLTTKELHNLVSTPWTENKKTGEKVNNYVNDVLKLLNNVYSRNEIAEAVFVVPPGTSGELIANEIREGTWKSEKQNLTLHEIIQQNIEKRKN